jgi:ABC-type Zn2+ transport system substrate-binding protein/surface adhesin
VCNLLIAFSKKLEDNPLLKPVVYDPDHVVKQTLTNFIQKYVFFEKKDKSEISEEKSETKMVEEDKEHLEHTKKDDEDEEHGHVKNCTNAAITWLGSANWLFTTCCPSNLRLMFSEATSSITMITVTSLR